MKHTNISEIINEHKGAAREFTLDQTLTVGNITTATLEDLLRFCMDHKLRDIYLISNDFIRGRQYNRKVIVTNRSIGHSEIQTLLKLMVGDELNRAYSGRSVNDRYVLTDKNDANNKSAFRVSITKFTHATGASLNCAVRPIPELPPSIQEVGLDPKVVEHIEHITQGLVLVVGATGQGKSSTLAAIQRHFLEKPSHIRILEFGRPTEFLWHKVNVHPTNHIVSHNVSETGKGSDMESFEEAIATSMRQAGDWLAVSEMTEVESFKAALEFSNTGHRVSSTVHANSIASAYARIYGKFPAEERDALLDGLITETEIMIAQRLYDRVGGGLVAVREVLIQTPAVKERLQIAAEKSVSTLKREVNTCIKEQQGSFVQQAQKHLAAGEISEHTLEQIRRTYG